MTLWLGPKTLQSRGTGFGSQPVRIIFGSSSSHAWIAWTFFLFGWVLGERLGGRLLIPLEPHKYQLPLPILVIPNPSPVPEWKEGKEEG